MDPGPDLVPCPACGDWEQEVLHSTKAHTTLRCLACQHVHTIAPAQPRIGDVRLIVSDGASSTSHRIPIVRTDIVEVDAEFDVEDMHLLVTGIETVDGRHVQKASGSEVSTIFAIRFETVLIKYTLNEGPTTRTLTERVDPDESVAIGAKRIVDGHPIVVKTIKDAENKTVRRGQVAARRIRRVFCDHAPQRSARWTPRDAAPRDGRRGAPAKRAKPPSRTGRATGYKKASSRKGR